MAKSGGPTRQHYDIATGGKGAQAKSGSGKAFKSGGKVAHPKDETTFQKYGSGFRKSKGC